MAAGFMAGRDNNFQIRLVYEFPEGIVPGRTQRGNVFHVIDPEKRHVCAGASF